jgi:hypothetical protein
LKQPFYVENALERERLRALVDRLTDEELSLPLGEGWTVGAALAHIAFWDQRAAVLMRRWKKSGVTISPVDTDVMNDALLPLCLAIPPRIAGHLAIVSAETIDRELEQASSSLIADIQRLGDKFRLWRSEHRRSHLDQIESMLRGRSQSIEA